MERLFFTFLEMQGVESKCGHWVPSQLEITKRLPMEQENSCESFFTQLTSTMS